MSFLHSQRSGESGFKSSEPNFLNDCMPSLECSMGINHRCEAPVNVNGRSERPNIGNHRISPMTTFDLGQLKWAQGKSLFLNTSNGILSRCMSAKQMGSYSDGWALPGEGQNSVLLSKIVTSTSVLPDRGRDTVMRHHRVGGSTGPGYSLFRFC